MVTIGASIMRRRVFRGRNREQGSLLQKPCRTCRSDPWSRSARRSSAGACSEGGIASRARSYKNVRLLQERPVVAIGALIVRGCV